MEEHPVIEREHTRVHEENKTEASKVLWVWWVGPDDVGGPARRCGSSRMKMGMDFDKWSACVISTNECYWLG